MYRNQPANQTRSVSGHCPLNCNLNVMKTGAPIGAPLFSDSAEDFLAAAAVIVAAVVVVVVAAAAAAVAEDQQQNNDPPPVVTAEAAADTVIITHKNTSKNFVELCCPHSML